MTRVRFDPKNTQNAQSVAHTGSAAPSISPEKDGWRASISRARTGDSRINAMSNTSRNDTDGTLEFRFNEDIFRIMGYLFMKN